MAVRFALAAFIAAWMTTVSAQPAPVTTADFSGTWNIEFMSHQIALVIETRDATHVTATMMMMGRDLPLKGELAGRTLTLVGDRAAGATEAPVEAADGAHGPPTAPPKPIVVTLEDDGTISGEMTTTHGPGTFTGERLKKRK
ncbi:MAG TPA: hypothetical protein VMW48_01585 [Vicinamibacterales bacterium]|nr:hypothetical protein [Vicinamibacterales bacterium]